MCGEAGKKNGNVKTAAQTEQKYSTNNYEITFENLEVSDDIENILAHRVLIDMIGIEEDEKQLFVPAARAGLQMLYRYMFAETTSANEGLPVPVSDNVILVLKMVYYGGLVVKMVIEVVGMYVKWRRKKS